MYNPKWHLSEQLLQPQMAAQEHQPSASHGFMCILYLGEQGNMSVSTMRISTWLFAKKGWNNFSFVSAPVWGQKDKNPPWISVIKAHKSHSWHASSRGLKWLHYSGINKNSRILREASGYISPYVIFTFSFLNIRDRDKKSLKGTYCRFPCFLVFMCVCILKPLKASLCTVTLSPLTTWVSVKHTHWANTRLVASFSVGV